MVVLRPIDRVGRDVVQQRDGLVIERATISLERQDVLAITLADRFCHFAIAVKRICRDSGVLQIKHRHQVEGRVVSLRPGPALPQNQPVLSCPRP